MPVAARASVLSDFVASVMRNPEKQTNSVSGGGNVQTMPLPKPAMNADPMAGKGGGDIKIVDDSALVPDEGPSGTPVEYERPKNSKISLYVVREGDALSSIGKLFGVSPNTILWANDLPRGSVIQVGQELTILPVTGVKHTVKKGDTLASIAKQYGGNANEIASFNGLDGPLAVGTNILIPDGEIAAAPATKVSAGIATPKGTPTQIGYYLRPIVGGTRTQGIHGYNGVDLAAPIGTPILASADGNVIIAKETGWNGGYGSYIVIQHNNGTQTLYSHASKVGVSVGQHVNRGVVIGAVGRSGKATGPHVHFEIRDGIKNPF
ncbi:MAG: M23 family metallopeptidase [bacterium]|nr:M23 family metallopeptidase [bacterium]